MYASQIIARILCALALALSVSCGTVEPTDGDGASGMGSMAGGGSAGDAMGTAGTGGGDSGMPTSDGAAADMGAMGGAAGNGSPAVGDAGMDALRACQVSKYAWPLSHSVACSDGCATECRDNLAHPVVGCREPGGTVCVMACGECP